MNNSAAKVGEIFREAGTAFTKLSEMTLMLQSMDDSPPGGKWSDEEVEMLRGCINRFAVELNKISQHIKNRTMRHLRCLLELDSGIIQDISQSPPAQIQPLPQPTLQLPEHHLQEQPPQQLPEQYLQEQPPQQLPAQYLQEQPPQQLPAQYLQEQPPQQLPAQYLQEQPPQQLPAQYLQEQPPQQLPAQYLQEQPPQQLPAQYLQEQPPQQLPAQYLQEQPPQQLPAQYLQEQPPQQLPAQYLQEQPPQQLPAQYLQEQPPQHLPAQYLQEQPPQQLPAQYLQEQPPQQLPAQYLQEQPPQQLPGHYLQEQPPLQLPAHYFQEQPPQQLSAHQLQELQPHQLPAYHLQKPTQQVQVPQQIQILSSQRQTSVYYLRDPVSHQGYSVTQQSSTPYQTRLVRVIPRATVEQFLRCLRGTHAHQEESISHQTPAKQTQLQHITEQPPALYLREPHAYQNEGIAHQPPTQYTQEFQHMPERVPVYYLQEPHAHQAEVIAHQHPVQQTQEFQSIREQFPVHYLQEPHAHQEMGVAHQPPAQNIQEHHHIPQQLPVHCLREQKQHHLSTPSQQQQLQQQLSVNIYSQGFPANDNILLHYFNPGVVPSTLPENIMQEDKIRSQPSPEFEDLQDPIVDNTLLAVPELIKLLDFDTNHGFSDFNSRESVTASIGTLHGEFPSGACNQEAATGSLVRREAHFSLRQAKDTWGHVVASVNNDNAEPHVGRILSSGHVSSYVSSSALSTGTPRNVQVRVTDSKKRPKFVLRQKTSTNNPVKIAPTPRGKRGDNASKTGAKGRIKTEEKPVGKFTSIGAFSSIFTHKDSTNQPIKNIKAATSEPISSASEDEITNSFAEGEERPGGKFSGPFSSIFSNNGSAEDLIKSLRLLPGDPVDGAPEPDKTINRIESEERSVGKILCTHPFSPLLSHNSSTNDPTGSLKTVIGDPVGIIPDIDEAICFNSNLFSASMSYFLGSEQFPSVLAQNDSTIDLNSSIQASTGEPVGNVTERFDMKSPILGEETAVCNFLYKGAFSSIFDLSTAEQPTEATAGYFSSIRAETIKEDEPSNAHRTDISGVREKSSGPRHVDFTGHVSADLASSTSTPAESTAGPRQARNLKSRRHLDNDNEESLPKKRGRKKASTVSTVTTTGPVTRSFHKKKQMKETEGSFE